MTTTIPAGDPSAPTVDPEVAAFEKRVGDSVDAKIKAALEEQRAQFDRELKALTETRRKGAGLPGYNPVDERDPEKSFSLGRVIHAHLAERRGEKVDYPEREVIHEFRALKEKSGELAAMQRATSEAGFGTTGGLLVSTQMMPELMPELLANSVALAAGVENLTGISGGPLQLPREEGGIVAYRKGEALSIPSSKESYSALTLSPKLLGARTFLSRSLLLQTQGRVRTYAERKLALKLALRMDLDFFKGEGGDEPVGIVHASAPASATTSWASVDYLGADQNVSDLLEDMVTGLKARNAYYGNGDVMWFAHPSAYSKLRKSKDADGKPLPLFEKRVANTPSGVATDDMLYGHKYAETTQLAYDAATDLLLFPVKAAYMALWDTIEIFVSEHAAGAAETGDLMVRAIAFNDSVIARGAHLQRASGWNNS